MLLLKLFLFLTTLVGLSLAQFDEDDNHFGGLSPRAKAKAPAPSSSSSNARSRTGGNAKKDTKATGTTKKTASSDALSPSQRKEWARMETYYRSTYNVPLLAFSVPVPKQGSPQPIPGRAAKAKGKRDVKNGKDIGVRKGSSGGGNDLPWGSIPIPQPPGFPNPGLTTQPIPGNGQAPAAVPDPRPETALNPNLPSVDDIVRYLDQRWPNGVDPQHLDRGDIRQRILFWTGGGMEAAATTANNLGLYDLATLVGNHYERYISEEPPRRFDPDTVGMWDRLSLALARWANSQVRIRIDSDAAGRRAQSIWNVYERPTLERRGIRIIWIDGSGNARTPVFPAVASSSNPPTNGTGSSASKKAKQKRALLLVARATHLGLLRKREAVAIATKIMRRSRDVRAKRDVAEHLRSRRDVENMYPKRWDVEDWHVRRDVIDEEDFMHEFW